MATYITVGLPHTYGDNDHFGHIYNRRVHLTLIVIMTLLATSIIGLPHTYSDNDLFGHIYNRLVYLTLTVNTR